MNKKTQTQQFKKAITQIANMGSNIKPEMIDWANIGKSAVHIARTAVAGKCKTCGKTNDFIIESRQK